jgi:hypothetical protein
MQFVYSGVWGVLEGLKYGSRDGVYEDEIVWNVNLKIVVQNIGANVC